MTAKAYSVGEFKSAFSEILLSLKKGERITVCYGKQKTPVGILIPFSSSKKSGIRLGILKGKASCKLLRSFKISDDELLEA